MSIAEEWLDYEQRVIPAAAGAEQRRCARRDFYAGAAALMKLANVTRLSNDGFNVAIHQELKAFQEAVRSGRA